MRKYIADVIESYTEACERGIEPGTALAEIIDTMVGHMTDAEQIEVLDMYGHRDLSEPRPDLTSWRAARSSMAYNALDAAVRENLPRAS